MHLSVWVIWNGSLRCSHRITSRLAIQLPDIDSAAPNSPVKWSLHSIMHISIDLSALELSPLPAPPFLVGTHLPSQISIQRPLIHLEIGGCIILCVYPLSLVLWNCLLRRHRDFWPAPIRLLRYQSSDRRRTCKLVVASYYAYIR
jgi:hypothetical protein